MTSFTVYKAKAGYSNAVTLRKAMQTSVDAALVDENNLPGAVPLYSQNSAGNISNAAANTLLSNLKLPRNQRLSVSYDPTCLTGGCQQIFIEASHCSATSHTQLIQYGDGFTVTLDDISGGGC
jgi:hypothetical protein